MRNFKYVKFSRSTARQNPQMIIDAYNKLLGNIEWDLKEFYQKKYKIDINAHGLIGEALAKVRKEFYLHSPYKVTIEVNAPQIIQLYNKIMEQDKKLIELNSKLEDIQRELVTFKRRFTDHISSFYT